MEPYLFAPRGPGSTNGNPGVELPELPFFSDPSKEGLGDQGFSLLLELLVRSGPPLPDTPGSADISPEEPPIPPSLPKQEISPPVLAEILFPDRTHSAQEDGEGSEETAKRPSEPEPPQEGQERAERPPVIPWTYPIPLILPAPLDHPSSEAVAPSSVDRAGKLMGPASRPLSTPGGTTTLETLAGAKAGSGPETILIEDTPGLDKEVRSGLVETGPEEGTELTENLQSMRDLLRLAGGEEASRTDRGSLLKDSPALAPAHVARERGLSVDAENGHGQTELTAPKNETELQRDSGNFTVKPLPPKEGPAVAPGQDAEATLPQEGRKIPEAGNEGTEASREGFRPVLDAMRELIPILKGGALPPRDLVTEPAAPGPMPLDRGDAGLPRGEAPAVGDLKVKGPSLRGNAWQPAGIPEKGGELTEDLQSMSDLDLPAEGEEGSRADQGSLLKDGPALAHGRVTHERDPSFVVRNPLPPEKGPTFALEQDAEAALPQEGTKARESGNKVTEPPREEFRPVLDAMKELLPILKGGALPPKDPFKDPVGPGPMHLDRGDAGLPRGEAPPVGNLKGEGPSQGRGEWQPAGILEKGGIYLRPEENRVWLRLEPELLGEIRGELELEHDRIKAHFIAENPMAKEALEGSLAQLKEALGEQGLRLDSFSVTVASNGQHLLGDGLASFRHWGGNGGRWQQGAGQQEAWEKPGTDGNPMDKLDRSRVDLFV